MRILFSGQVPKDPNYPEATEDASGVATDSTRIAISDGASESFDSKSWAQLLVDAYIISPELKPDWLEKVIKQYNAKFDTSSLSWSKQAAFERGSFATLLGVEECSTHFSVDIMSVGDSLAVLLSGTDMIDSFPYQNPKQFQQHPELFCTTASLNSFFGKSNFFSQHHKTWDLKQLSNPTLLCMTDALGEWALRMVVENTPQWGYLLSIKDTTQLEALVLSEREKKIMRVDDVTLISVALELDCTS